MKRNIKRKYLFPCRFLNYAGNQYLTTSPNNIWDITLVSGDLYTVSFIFVISLLFYYKGIQIQCILSNYFKEVIIHFFMKLKSNLEPKFLLSDTFLYPCHPKQGYIL